MVLYKSRQQFFWNFPIFKYKTFVKLINYVDKYQNSIFTSQNGKKKSNQNQNWIFLTGVEHPSNRRPTHDTLWIIHCHLVGWWVYWCDSASFNRLQWIDVAFTVVGWRRCWWIWFAQNTCQVKRNGFQKYGQTTFQLFQATFCGNKIAFLWLKPIEFIFFKWKNEIWKKQKLNSKQTKIEFDEKKLKFERNQSQTQKKSPQNLNLWMKRIVL